MKLTGIFSVNPEFRIVIIDRRQFVMRKRQENIPDVFPEK